MTASVLACDDFSPDRGAASSMQGNDLACSAAVFRVMRKVDEYLRCEATPEGCDQRRRNARQELQGALRQELLGARILGRPHS